MIKFRDKIRLEKKMEQLKAKELRLATWQLKIKTVIHGTDTFLGKFFDISLLILILISILVIMLESVKPIYDLYSEFFIIIEFIITGLFTIEYILRIISLNRPLSYVFSFYGLIDLLSILPTYLSLIFTGAKPLTVIRALRFLRIFRILEMTPFLTGANVIIQAIYDSRYKIIVFVISMLTIVIILGAIMFSIETPEAGFTSIPRSIYWAIITITTVGYGDIAPMTALGQAIAAFIMLVGYSIIAVPTGIVSAEIVAHQKDKIKKFACPSCGKEGHDVDAEFCKFCGEKF
jgi:voltage-gated potassium channel